MISWVTMDRIVERKRAADGEYHRQGAGKVLRSHAKRLTDGELLIKWQRWFPDKPSFEALDAKMEAGYELRAFCVGALLLGTRSCRRAWAVPRLRKLLGSRGQLVVLCLVSFGWLPAEQALAPTRPVILGKGTQLGLSYDCGTIDAALLTRSAATQTLCPLFLLGGAAFYTDRIREDNLLVALNKEGAMVAVHDRTAEATSSFSGTIDHVGQQDDVIHWGLWRSGVMEALPSKRRFTVDESTAVPYIVGVSSHNVAANDRIATRRFRLSDLPTDVVANYTLAGDVGVVSRKDYQGNIVPVGKIQAAQATVDFKSRTGHLDLSVEVRGTIASIQFPLEPQNKILGFGAGARSAGAPCHRPAPDEFCPAATVQFYGRDGQFLGITFSYGHNAVLPEATSSAAHLNNVLAQGAVVLRRN